MKNIIRRIPVLLVAFLLAHMPNPDGSSEEARRKLYDSQLSQLKHWR